MNIKSFTEEPVSKIFLRYLFPSICGTMVTSIYVLADTIIIGKGIGADAMAALNIVLPLFNVFFGTGLLFGVGGSVLMSIAGGKGDNQKNGDRYFTIAVLLNAVTSILYMVLFLIFMEDIARFLGATKVTLPYVMDYAPYVIWGLGFFSFSTFLQTFVRNDGAPKLSMFAVVTGGISNVFLDILFVFTFDMKMAGASIASVIGTTITTCHSAFPFFLQEKRVAFYIKRTFLFLCKTDFSKRIYQFYLEMSSGVVMFFFNIQILKYIGDVGVAMYGVIANTSIVVICLCNGINQASQPIISINHGAGLYNRIHIVKKLGLRTAFLICSVPAILGLIVPNMFTNIFLNPNAEILALSPTAIRIYFTGFFVIGLNMFIVGYFQSTVKPQISLFLCLMKSCVLSIAFVYILPLFFGVTGIWAAVPLAEFITLGLGIYFLKRR